MAAKQCILTPELIARVRFHYPRCLYKETCADLLGVGRRTWSGWVKRGAVEVRRIERGHEPVENEAVFVEFHRAVMQAEAQAIHDAIDTIQQAAKRDWHAAAWLAERRRPELWGRDRLDVVALNKKIDELNKRLAEQPAAV